ncbi:MAG TPA: phenylalanine--tRNA ligase subunit beta [Planctomycetota bacterium]
MKLSLNWIAEFVDLTGETSERIAELLSLHTAEVESVDAFGEGIAGVLVGHVVECGRHPDAEKLSVTWVDYGGAEPVQVVCGAPNVARGQKIAFAPVGTTLPGGLKLKKAKLRGQVSAGMICSERELELSDEHKGILELDPAAPIGALVVDFLQLRDSVLEIDNKSLTHRPDLWGHYGFARELAAILGRELRPLLVLEAWPPGEAGVPVDLEDPDCPLYLGLRVDLGGAPAASPQSIRRRLLAVGQRPVNDVVDLTNYVLHELGQPTHAFDFDKLRGPRIVVRSAAEQEPLRTLDDVERRLDPRDLVIADAGGPVALAGIMGGAESEVGAGTGSLFLESAAFAAARVRRSSTRLGLRSEASARFEKSLDPALAETALRRFAYLLAAVRPQARICGAPASAGAARTPHIRLALEPARAAAILGLPLDRGQVVAPLRALGFGVDDDGGSALQVEVPSWRATKDVTTEIDLVEEVGRMHGYDRIQARPFVAPVVAPWRNPVRELGRRLVDRLAFAHGGHETQGYTFLDSRWIARLGLPESAFARIDNPVQDGVDCVRRDPVPSLLEQAAGNVREHERGMLFELGKGYEPGAVALPEERIWLAAALWRRTGGPADGADSVFGACRVLVEDIARACAFEATAASGAEHSQAPWAHPARAATWSAQGRPIGFSGAVDPRLVEALDAPRTEIGVVLLDLAVLAEIGGGARSAFRSPARLPAIKVDVALALPVAVPYARVEAGLRAAGGKILESLDLFDRFQGGALGAGVRSLAFHAVLRAADRTLTDKDERKFLQRAEQLAEELGGALRK